MTNEPVTESLDPMVLCRAAIARAAKWSKRYPADDSVKGLLVSLRQELAELKLAKHISAIVATAPPLSDEQIERLSVLFRHQGEVVPST